MSQLVSTEPATGATLWTGKISDVNAEVARARAAWPQWAAQPLTSRIEIVRRFANLVRSKNDKLADLIARETGKPIWEALTEVDAVINKVEISVAAYSERTGQKRMEGAMGDRTAIRHKPHGVMAVLGPYNFPAHLPNGHIVPALIAGNALVFKPSEKTPAVGQMLVDLYHAAGVPDDAIRLIIGGPLEGKTLTAHADVDGVLFTGSAQTGALIHRKFAGRPEVMLALELGGNNALIVWPPVDAKAAANLIAHSAFATSGQRCSCARRLIVPQGAEGDKIIAALAELTPKISVGPADQTPEAFLGPVVNADSADRAVKFEQGLTALGGKSIKPVHCRSS